MYIGQLGGTTLATALVGPFNARFGAVSFSVVRKKIRTRLQPIRTAGEIQEKIIIQPLQRIPLYQKLTQKVEELLLLGMSVRTAAKSLGVNRSTVRRAAKHIRKGVK